MAQQDRLPPKEKWSHVTLQGVVEVLDLEAREVTLRGPKGNLLTVLVDQRVERLDEVAIGDVVSTEFWTYIKAEFRDPTPEEREVPLVVIAEGGKAPKGMPPAVAVGAVVRAIVTIEIINRPDMEVTVKGPRGKYVTILAEDRALLEKLHVGEEVVVTYAEALALSLEKME
jgi:hypothetical protein